jgi:hypothetical protein
VPTLWTKPGLLDLPVTVAAGVLDELADRWHPKLVESGARVAVAFATNDQGPGLRHDGRPAAGIVRVLPAKWRVLFGYDALIEIDGGVWDDLETDGRRALLDHELAHLVPVERRTAADTVAFQLDDYGRPRLKIHRGDFFVGDGFLAVIDRHGPAALEVAPVRDAYALVTAHLPEVFRCDPHRNGG